MESSSDKKVYKTSITGQRWLDNKLVNLEITNLRGINIIYGKNGSGKSSFMRNVFSNNAEDYHLVVAERTGRNLLHSSGHLDQENNLESKKSVRKHNSDPDYRTRAMSKTTNIMSSFGYKVTHGLEITNLNAKDITNIFSTFLPDFTFRFSKHSPHLIEIFRHTSDGEQQIISTDQISTGQAEAISLAADIVSQAVEWKGQNKTLLIDEPDSHLHIDLEYRFSLFIKDIYELFDIQILISSHSNSLVTCLLNLDEEIGLVCFDEEKEKISTVRVKKNYILSGLLSSEIFLASVLGRKLLIVEGNDDYLVWNQVNRSRKFKDVMIIHANGGDILEYKKIAEKVIKAGMDNQSNLGIVLLDGHNKEDFQNQSEAVLIGKRMNCYGLENLYLTNEILGSISKDVNLEEILERIKNNTNTLEEERNNIEEIRVDKKSSKVSKSLIKKIHNEIDNHSNSRDWRVLLGKYMGENEPTGELKEFLNPEIVDYFWR